MTSAGLRRIGDFVHPDAIQETLETFFDGMTDAEREQSMIWQMWGGQSCLSVMLVPCCVVQHKALAALSARVTSARQREARSSCSAQHQFPNITVEHLLCSNARSMWAGGLASAVALGLSNCMPEDAVGLCR